MASVPPPHRAEILEGPVVAEVLQPEQARFTHAPVYPSADARTPSASHPHGTSAQPVPASPFEGPAQWTAGGSYGR